MAATPNHHDIHFVGSVPLGTNTEVFTRLATTFPDQLRRIPDGECGDRYNFTAWQAYSFKPFLIKRFPGAPLFEEPEEPWTIEPINTRYDDVALESYKEFCRLREEGVIKKGVRFQVSVPTPVNILAPVLQAKYQVAAEPHCEKAIINAVRRIQDSIPKEDLAIQWDMALDVLMIEFAGRPEFRPPMISEHWFHPVKEGIIERAIKVMNSVDADVPIGAHLCYGDIEHQHLIQPVDLGLIVEMANAITAGLGRNLDFVHMPVPKTRTDDTYFAPLSGLKVGEKTELVLGLVHPWDVEGTRKRMSVAEKFVKKYSVATECGLGRAKEGELDELVGVFKEVTGGGEKLNGSANGGAK